MGIAVVPVVNALTNKVYTGVTRFKLIVLREKDPTVQFAVSILVAHQFCRDILNNERQCGKLLHSVKCFMWRED